MAEGILLDKLREVEGEADATFDVNLPTIKSSSGATYYAKAGSHSEKEQYSGESESLKHIYAAAPGLCPRVLSSGVNPDPDGTPYFISDYLDFSRLTTATTAKLAERLSKELHQHKSPNGRFGFDVPTFCGATRLENGWYDTWEACYDALIGGLLDGLSKKGSNKELCEKGGLVRSKVIPHLLGPLKIDPVILHGDLWSGNVGTDKGTNEPVIFDPSSFYGHNEADLAIARIFGGFSPEFFATYHQHLPKTEPVDQYEMRVDLYELFHYLNHALIFGGGGYASSAMQKMDRLLRYCS